MLSVFDWILNVMNEAVCECLNEWMDGWMHWITNCIFLCDKCDVWVFDLFQEIISNGMSDCVIGIYFRRLLQPFAVADLGGCCQCMSPLWVQILSFWHTNFSKCSCLGSWHPPYEVSAPPTGNPGSTTGLVWMWGMNDCVIGVNC